MRTVTFARFLSINWDTHGGKQDGWSVRPACFEIMRTQLHETPEDCTPACQDNYPFHHAIGFPHVDTAGGEVVTTVTPLCGATWISTEVVEWYATPDAPAFDHAGCYEDRALILSLHRKRCTFPHAASLP